jgi:hypothetical protein
MAKTVKRSAESWIYVLKADRTLDPSEQTRFTLRPMTHAERAATMDDAARTLTTSEGVVSVGRFHQNAYEIALRHIVSIENFPIGAPQPWPKDADERARYLDQLDDDDIVEVGDEVWRRSRLGADTAAVKNSLPPELTSNSGGSSATATSTTAPPAPSGQG